MAVSGSSLRKHIIEHEILGGVLTDVIVEVGPTVEEGGVSHGTGLFVWSNDEWVEIMSADRLILELDGKLVYDGDGDVTLMLRK
jgi:hypothetical protein